MGKVNQLDELKLDVDVRQELLELQNRGLDINQLLREMLRQRQQKIQEEKQQLAQELEKKSKQQPSSTSRHIPKKITAVLRKEFGTKCAHSNCANLSFNIHHQQRFALDPRHNRIYLLPLCKQHHEIAHSIDVRVMEKRKQTT